MVKLPLSQSDLITIGLVRYSYLQQDLQDFQQFNGVKFSAQFLIGFQKSIAEARDVPSDETIVDEGTELTADVSQLMVEARRLYKYVKYFVEEAYANNIGRKNRFGLDDYDEIRQNSTKMLIFLSNLYTQCGAYQADLAAMGMDTNKIQELLHLRERLQASIMGQKEYTGTRMEATQARQQVFTTLYDYIKQVAKAGKIIYEDINEAKYRRYLMPKTSDMPTEREIAIQAQTQKAIEIEDLAADTMLEIINTGETDLLFYTADTIADQAPANALRLAPNEDKVVKASDIMGASYQLLVVRNDSSQAGACKVFVLEDDAEDLQ